MFGDFYRNRRVLVTGHTGFKGAWRRLDTHREQLKLERALASGDAPWQSWQIPTRGVREFLHKIEQQ